MIERCYFLKKKQKLDFGLVLHRLIWSWIIFGYLFASMLIGVLICYIIFTALAYFVLHDITTFFDVFKSSATLTVIKVCAGVSLFAVIGINLVIALFEK